MRRNGPPRVAVIRTGTCAPVEPTELVGMLPGGRLDPRDLERLRADAHDTGYADGHREGWEAASAEARRELDASGQRAAAALDALDAAIAAARQAEQVTLEGVADQAVALALGIARAVLGRELAVAADPGGDALARALALAPEGVAARARLHPDDAAGLDDLGVVTGDRAVEVVADPAVEPGGCVLECGPTTIDAQIGPALARVQEVLR